MRHITAPACMQTCATQAHHCRQPQCLQVWCASKTGEDHTAAQNVTKHAVKRVGFGFRSSLLLQAAKPPTHGSHSTHSPHLSGLSAADKTHVETIFSQTPCMSVPCHLQRHAWVTQCGVRLGWQDSSSRGSTAALRSRCLQAPLSCSSSSSRQASQQESRHTCKRLTTTCLSCLADGRCCCCNSKSSVLHPM
jgi:hypothetical protein